jgi:hypothetical protein
LGRLPALAKAEFALLQTLVDDTLADLDAIRVVPASVRTSATLLACFR